MACGAEGFQGVDFREGGGHSSSCLQWILVIHGSYGRMYVQDKIVYRVLRTSLYSCLACDHSSLRNRLTPSTPSRIGIWSSADSCMAGGWGLNQNILCRAVL
jgi:hypothetical protein